MFVDIRLEKCFNDAVSVIESVLGSTIIYNGYEITSVTVNKKFKSVFGRCRTYCSEERCEIQVAELMLNAPYNELVNTMIHEILHTLKNCQCHTGKWKEYADKISNDTIYKISTTSKGEWLQINEDSYKYKFVCKHCGEKVYKNRKSKFTEHPEYYRCVKCGGRFVEIK